ncbi:MAG: hypothetical protein J6Y89_08465, partial [Lachnospiraceae bacterium]|nr:hypothetical protein [Lachnospiraceae bacterium]
MNTKKILTVMPYILGVLILILVGVIIFSKLGETGPEGGQAESTPTPTLALFANNTEKENKTTDAPATGTEKVTEAPVVTEEPAPTQEVATVTATPAPTATPVPTQAPTPTPVTDLT